MKLDSIRSLLGKIKVEKEQLVIFLLVGILMLVVAIPVERQNGEAPENREKTENTDRDYGDELETRLENLLETMEGVGTVEVMITFQSSSEKIIEKDIERTTNHLDEEDGQGGKRTSREEQCLEETILLGQGDHDSPYVSKEISPVVEGVAVIAQGGEDAVVKKNISEIIQALFNIPQHKIRIMKGRRDSQ